MQQNGYNIVDISPAVIGGEAVQTINARELHVYLENGDKFSDWIGGRIQQYGFVEGQDFVIASGNAEAITGRRGGHNRIDYHITLDMAKELAMVERNERGRLARKYFIECEKQLKAQLVEHSSLSEIEVARRYLASLEEAQRLKEKIAANLLFPRGTITGGEPISIKAIKAQFAPYLAEPKIRLVLRWYGQGRTRFQFGSHENASFQTFQREGLEEVFEHFSRDRTMRVSATGTSVIIDHECLDGETCRVPRDAAIAHLGFTEHDFTMDSQEIASDQFRSDVPAGSGA